VPVTDLEAYQTRAALGTGLDWGFVLAADAALLTIMWVAAAGIYFTMRWIVRGFGKQTAG